MNSIRCRNCQNTGVGIEGACPCGARIQPMAAIEYAVNVLAGVLGFNQHEQERITRSRDTLIKAMVDCRKLADTADKPNEGG